MSKYRNALPQLQDALFLSDGGLETTLIHHEGVSLPYFAAFDLLKDAAGTQILRRYFDRYADLARAHGLGVVLETATWRASADWGAKLGYDVDALVQVNRRAVDLLLDVRAARETPLTPVVISGNLGPRGDGYRADVRMSASQARDYHAPQVHAFAATRADMVAAFTMNYVEEALGIVEAAKAAHIPVAISFTVETDGTLPSGDSLSSAIERTDAQSDGYPAYYMINCAHPTHFEATLARAGAWRERIRGVRANASKRSHAELDDSAELDIGSPDELGTDYARLRRVLPRLAVAGGCCGTDDRHVGAIARCLAARSATTESAT